MNAKPRTRDAVPCVVSKPAGGFRPIGLRQVGMAWWAYRSGLLPRYLDFRVYLALHEVAERRLAAARTRKRDLNGWQAPAPGRSELAREVRLLVGSSSERMVRSSLSRVESIGLVTHSGPFLRFANGLECLIEPCAKLSAMPACWFIERRLAVPRPVLRMMARSATPSVAATALGYLIRCVWWRGRELYVAGSCRAAFISEWFGLDQRSVKRARSALRRMAWLAGTGGEPCSGGDLPDLAWLGGPEAPARKRRRRTVLSPPEVVRDTMMSPHTICTQLPPGSKNQQPANRRPAGIREVKEEDSRPRLLNVQLADLRSDERLDLLFEEAGKRGLSGRSTADRLRFFAAATRALRVASANPCGFFAAIVRGKLWHHISQIDEDLALERLRGGRLPRCNEPSENSQACRRKPNSGPRKGRCVAEPPQLDSLVSALAARCCMDKKLQRARSVNPAGFGWDDMGRKTASAAAHPPGDERSDLCNGRQGAK